MIEAGSELQAAALREAIRSAGARARLWRGRVRVAAELALAAGGLVALTLAAVRVVPSGNDCMGPALRAVGIVLAPFFGGTGGLIAGAVVGVPLALIFTVAYRCRQRDEILARVGACPADQLAAIVGPLT